MAQFKISYGEKSKHINASNEENALMLFLLNGGFHLTVKDVYQLTKQDLISLADSYGCPVTIEPID